MKYFLLSICVFTGIYSYSQRISAADEQQLTKQEEALKSYANNMVQAEEASKRFEADSIFIRLFVKALRTPYSFNYPFDSILTVSKLYPPDSSFRIFTWQFEKDESYYRQRGAIQMKTVDGSLKLFPLIDYSEFTKNPVDSVRDNMHWIGAIYYNIILKTFKEKNYYTLLGYDGNSFNSTRKWIDVLTFDQAGTPQFGGRYFAYQNDSLKPPQPAFRFSLEYKKDARARLNYDPEMDMIIFDHLISENNDQSKKFTLIPDGDYEGFKWSNGRWVHVSKVFNFKVKDGEFPMPAPIKDDSGKSNEKLLLEQSKKNMQSKPVKKAPKDPQPNLQESY